jgi:2-iminoacetate synthase ThiH
MSLDEIVRLIRGAGKVPAERDSFYNVLRTFEGEGSEGTSAVAAVGT